MEFKEIMLVILAGVLFNNFALERFLGVTPLLGSRGGAGKAARMGLAVTIVMLVTAALAWPLQTLVLDKLNLGYLQLLAFVAVVLAVVYLAELIVNRAMHGSLGVYFPTIALNSAVLGLAVDNAAEGYGFWASMAAALGAGLGFMLALVLFSGVQSRIDEKYVPRAFRGLPVSLLAASIMSMVLVAFK